MKKVMLSCLLSLWCSALVAQTHSGYIGAGNNQGVKVTTSHNETSAKSGGKTIDGIPANSPPALTHVSRFLAHATMGYDYELIQSVANQGYAAWINQQFALPHKKIDDYVTEVVPLFEKLPPNYKNIFVGKHQFRAIWWNIMLRSPELLRERVAYALSQILVVSPVGIELIEEELELLTTYYDILQRHAFGNYRDLLIEMSKNPAMGLYLSHMNNPKADPTKNIHPDENYAREVMQLFTIGLYELNNDGTRKLDQSGNPIPTYNNGDIHEFAKVFTGWGDGSPPGVWGILNATDIFGHYPLKMYPEAHDTGQKKLLNGKVVPAGQTGEKDLADAIDNLFNHPNTAPFVGRALIKLMVTSNPSPAYINRVANAFINNGAGIRGDMKAVVKAILLDPEARSCDPLQLSTGGKLREPIMRYTNFLKAFNVKFKGNVFVDAMTSWHAGTGQVPAHSPSVFNFYLPDYQPNGPIAAQKLVAPVFQIHNSTTAVGYINQVSKWTVSDFVMGVEEEIDHRPDLSFGAPIGDKGTMDYTDELALVSTPAALVDRLSLLLAAGQLSTKTKAVITNAVSRVNTPQEKLKMALYLIMICPDYAVLK